MPTHLHPGGCHLPDVLKSSPACQNSYPFTCIFALPNISMNELWIVNDVFFASQIEIWETVFQNCSYTYPIDKDIPLTFWLICDFHYFFFCDGFFQWKNYLVSEGITHSAKCHMTNILWAFIISNLWNNSKAWEMGLIHLSVL